MDKAETTEAAGDARIEQFLRELTDCKMLRPDAYIYRTRDILSRLVQAVREETAKECAKCRHCEFSGIGPVHMLGRNSWVACERIDSSLRVLASKTAGEEKS